MSAESFDQAVERLFNEAIDLPAERREAHVRASAGDERVAAEVLALLRADASETIDALREPVLESSLVGLSAHAQAPHSAPEAPERAGGWTLENELFSDETGAFRLGRDAGGLERCVKVYRAAAADDARRAQRRERTLVEAMEHAGVPRLIDFAGRAEAPYLVFDCEAGVGLVRFCDEARVPVPGRLELFARFGDAIAHAHERGVIHGSITPAKLRCEECAGGVRFLVLGFGAALSRRAALIPEAEAAPYLAPEHWVGVTARDTLGDVFALGAVLYELLVGVTPESPGVLLRRGAEGAGPGSWTAVPRPSSRLTALGPKAEQIAEARWIDTPGLERLLRERMDPIVSRSIEIQAGQRYATAADLVEDVRAVISDVWPDEQAMGISERASRWMRRLFRG